MRPSGFYHFCHVCTSMLVFYRLLNKGIFGVSLTKNDVKTVEFGGEEYSGSLRGNALGKNY